MQKKIIALAVAGLVSGAAFAESNVTLYGIVDVAYEYKMDNNNGDINDASQIEDGGLDGSRVGVKGEEDLGNGLKAGFDATWAFDADYESSVNMGEGSSVWLSGNWGKVRAGYYASFLDQNTNTDASGRHGSIHTGTLYDTGKWANFVGYYSPSFNGLQVKVGFSSNIKGDENNEYDEITGIEDGKSVQYNTRAYAAALAYDNGPLKAGIAYAYYDPEAASDYVSKQGGGEKAGHDWNAGVSYTVGQSTFSLFGAHQKMVDNEISNNMWLDGKNYDENRFWALGFNTYITPNDQIKAGYGQSKLNGANGNDDEDLTAWNLNYFHSLSKRSTLYVMYGNLDNEDLVGKSATYTKADNSYQQSFKVGMRHTF